MALLVQLFLVVIMADVLTAFIYLLCQFFEWFCIVLCASIHEILKSRCQIKAAAAIRPKTPRGLLVHVA